MTIRLFLSAILITIANWFSHNPSAVRRAKSDIRRARRDADRKARRIAMEKDRHARRMRRHRAR